MNITAWILFGIISGLVASLVRKSQTPRPKIIFLSVTGAMAGGILADMLFGTGIGGFSLLAFFVVSVVTVSALFLGRMLEIV